MSKKELISDIRRILNRLRDVLPRRIRKEIKKRFVKQKTGQIFQNKNKKRSMNILLNWQDVLIKRKKIVIMIVKIHITMEKETLKVYLVMLRLMAIANQQYLKLLLRKMRKMKAVKDKEDKRQNFNC